MDFPHWYQPRRDVPAILVVNEDELQALKALGWPDKQCPVLVEEISALPQKPDSAPIPADHRKQLEQQAEKVGVKHDRRWNDKRLAAEIAAKTQS